MIKITVNFNWRQEIVHYLHTIKKGKYKNLIGSLVGFSLFRVCISGHSHFEYVCRDTTL